MLNLFLMWLLWHFVFPVLGFMLLCCAIFLMLVAFKAYRVWGPRR